MRIRGPAPTMPVPGATCTPAARPLIMLCTCDTGSSFGRSASASASSAARAAIARLHALATNVVLITTPELDGLHGTLQNLQYQMRRQLLRAKYFLLRLLVVRFLRMIDVHELAGIPV